MLGVVLELFRRHRLTEEIGQVLKNILFRRRKRARLRVRVGVGHGTDANDQVRTSASVRRGAVCVSGTSTFCASGCLKFVRGGLSRVQRSACARRAFAVLRRGKVFKTNPRRLLFFF